MGPRSIDRGISECAGRRERSNAMLQWGRDLSIAELCWLEVPLLVGYALQWGRDLSIAEFATNQPIDRGGVDASMGPRSIDRGIKCRSFA